VTMWDSYLKNKNTKKKQFLASANMWGGTGTFKNKNTKKKQFLASVNMWGGTGTFKNKNTKKIFLTDMNVWDR
jgi:hypothetical protein